MSLPRILRDRLTGLRILVDVQHLYKKHRPGDRGALFTLADGRHVWEAQAASGYAAALVGFLQERGAKVVTNDPQRGLLVGTYSNRNLWANAYHAHAYLACHVNAGGGHYAMCEYLVGGGGASLGSSIGASLIQDFGLLLELNRMVPLSPGQRGYACIGAVQAPCCPVLLEPFFGDHRPSQELFAADRLVALGRSIGEGVARWWEAMN